MNKGKLVGLTLSAWALVCVLGIGNSPALAQTETWHLDPPHSAAQFAVKHMGISTVRGTFAKVSGDLQYSAADPSKSMLLRWTHESRCVTTIFEAQTISTPQNIRL
jgi:polyisoprenoid-binding protein YceI